MSAPEQIAHYRITGKLGEGGMGEVYRATDTKLGRDVAIKMIPEAFAPNAERMAWFTREAQMLAALNHPNVAAIYGVEDRALVMELVEGPTLADRIRQGALPPGEALAIARQIADALEAAHDKGIVHRDLKPANIKIRPDGTVKVLDFGLAKIVRPTSVEEIEQTQTLSMTGVGTVLGTPSYMAPEQAQGKPVDKRADIWAFGVVLCEMLTGRRLFPGATNTEILAAVLTREPDYGHLPASTHRLLRRCLEKDPKRRLRDIGEARFVLEEPTPVATRRRPVAWIAATAVLAAALAVALWRSPQPKRRALVRLNVDLGSEAARSRDLGSAISPDGTRLVFVARDAAGNTQLALRPLDQSKSLFLAGTENAASPFFSPDGQWIGFFADGKLKKIGAQGGAVVTIASVPGALGASWGDDQNIVYGALITPLMRVSSNGGTPQRLMTKPGTLLGERGDATHRWPQVLPGAKAILFTSHKIVTGFDDATIEALVVATGERKIILRGGYFGRYLPDTGNHGYLLYAREGALFSVPFDADTLTVRGTGSPVLDDLAGDSDSGAGQFDTGGGTLVYRSGKGPPRSWPVLWLDSSGKTEPLIAAPGAYYTLRLSPDGTRLAYTADHGDQGREIEVYDLRNGTTLRLTSTHEVTLFPVWSPDGKYIVFESSSPHGYGLGVVRSDGSGTMQRIGENNSLMIPYSFSPEGRLVYSANGVQYATFDTGDPDHPKLVNPAPLRDIAGSPAVSPDGRWIAYRSAESGRYEVYVRPFPGPGAKWQVSTGGEGYGGIVWASDGRLFWLSPDGRIMVADCEGKGASFSAGKPRVWSAAQVGVNGFPRSFSSTDGKRFAITPPRESALQQGPVHLTFALNFLESLRPK